MTFKKKIFIVICCVCLLGLTLFYPLANASTYQWRDNTNQYQEQFDNDPSQPDTIPPYEIPEVVAPDVDERYTRYDNLYSIDIDNLGDYIETYLLLDKVNYTIKLIFQFLDTSDYANSTLFIRTRDGNLYPGINRNNSESVVFLCVSADDYTFVGSNFNDIPYRLILKSQDNDFFPTYTQTTARFYNDNVYRRTILEWDIIQESPIEEGNQWNIAYKEITLFSTRDYVYNDFESEIILNYYNNWVYRNVLNVYLDFMQDYTTTYLRAYEDGYINGYETGYKNGYHDSYLKVVNGGITSSWFTGLFDGVQGFLNIKFGQISIGAIILIPLSITIVWFIIRQFRGGGGGD